MTISELNAEVLRNLSIVAEDENMLKRLAKYLRRMVAEKQNDPTLMTEEEFFARVDEAKQEIAAGKGRSFASLTDLDKHIRAL